MRDNHQPLLTIGIPTFNRANSYLRQTLQCALNQTYRNIEIIVSDNCSTDGTTPLVMSIPDRRLRYIKQDTNIGMINNENFCLQEAKGDYFLLLHDDDLIDSDLVEVGMMAANGNPNVGLIRTGTRIINAEGAVLSKSYNKVAGFPLEAFFRAWFAGRTSIYLCSTLFHTQRLRDIGGFGSKHNLFDDLMPEAQLAAAFDRVDVKEIKASFRRHNQRDEYTVMHLAQWCEDSLLLLDLMCKLAGENKALRKEGLQFFSRANYFRAGFIKSPWIRYRAYLEIFKCFNYRYLPPVPFLLRPIFVDPLYHYTPPALRKRAKRIFNKFSFLVGSHRFF